MTAAVQPSNHCQPESWPRRDCPGCFPLLVRPAAAKPQASIPRRHHRIGHIGIRCPPPLNRYSPTGGTENRRSGKRPVSSSPQPAEKEIPKNRAKIKLPESAVLRHSRFDPVRSRTAAYKRDTGRSPGAPTRPPDRTDLRAARKKRTSQLHRGPVSDIIAPGTTQAKRGWRHDSDCGVRRQ